MKKKIVFIALICILAAAFFTVRIFARAGVSGPGRAVNARGLSGMLTYAEGYEKAGDLLKARDAYQSALEKYPTSRDAVKIQESLDSLNIKILFSPIITPDSFRYEVKKGDSLSRIAASYNTTVELLTESNRLKTNRISPGDKIKVNKAKFGIFVDKAQNTLTLKSNGEIMKIYKVATGRNNCTPTGTFDIVTRIVDPPWYVNNKVIPARSPENILGSRWLGISKKGYGIHGTTEPESIGTQSTSGCVRMLNADVEELFKIVPVGTEVVIAD